MRRTVWAVALVIAIVAAAWPPAALNASASVPAGTGTTVLTAFRPSRDGFAFRNPRPDPNQSPVRRFFSGRCGGMTYAALDAYSAGSRLRGTVDSPAILTRSADSIAANVARFALWSMWPDANAGASGPVGVGTLTRREELPRLTEDLRGGPVALGLVRARSLLEIGRNHQVVAYAADVSTDTAVIWVYDSCQPGNDDVRLVIDLTRPEAPIREYASGYVVAVWRGAFVESYAPVAPNTSTPSSKIATAE